MQGHAAVRTDMARNTHKHGGGGGQEHAKAAGRVHWQGKTAGGTIAAHTPVLALPRGRLQVELAQAVKRQSIVLKPVHALQARQGCTHSATPSQSIMSRAHKIN